MIERHGAWIQTSNLKVDVDAVKCSNFNAAFSTTHRSNHSLLRKRKGAFSSRAVTSISTQNVLPKAKMPTVLTSATKGGNKFETKDLPVLI